MGFHLGFLQLFKSEELLHWPLTASKGPPGGRLSESPSKDPRGSHDHRFGLNTTGLDSILSFRRLSSESQSLLPLQENYSQREPNQHFSSTWLLV